MQRADSMPALEEDPVRTGAVGTLQEEGSVNVAKETERRAYNEEVMSLILLRTIGVQS